MKPHMVRHRSGYWKGEFIRGQVQNWAVTVITWMENISQEEAKRTQYVLPSNMKAER